MKISKFDFCQGHYFLFCVVTLISLSACHNKPDETLVRFVENLKMKPSQAAKPWPEEINTRKYSYEASTLRDPFDLQEGSNALTGAHSATKEGLMRSKEYLELYPLESLRVVGLLKKQETYSGIVKDTHELIHRVQIGNYLGQNNGKIIAIDHQGILLEETVWDETGKEQRRTITLPLQEASPHSAPSSRTKKGS